MQASYEKRRQQTFQVEAGRGGQALGEAELNED